MKPPPPRKIQVIADTIRQHDACLVLTHVNPDGDALGSMLGLALGLEALGLRAWCACDSPLPAIYRFLPGAERIQRELPPQPFSLAVVVDADGIARVGRFAPQLERICTIIDIDHHATEKAFGHLRWVDPRAAATGEMIHRLLRTLRAPLSPEIATCLYTAIVTDTGRFCYANTTPRALRAAAQLVRAGASPAHIYREIYESKSFSASRLLGLALGRMRQDADGRIVVSTLTQQDFSAAASSADETEGIIDYLRAVRATQAAALLVELPEGSVKVSLRSQGQTDVGEVALAFGGGGHVNAAGCTVPGPLPDAERRVLQALRGALPRE